MPLSKEVIKFHCPHCQTHYRIQPNRLQGVSQLRCTKCYHRFSWDQLPEDEQQWVKWASHNTLEPLFQSVSERHQLFLPPGPLKKRPQRQRSSRKITEVARSTQMSKSAWWKVFLGLP